MPSDFLVPQERVIGDIRSRNLRMMMAYTVHKRGLCPKCGYPRAVCRSQSGFEAQREVCHATAVVEARQEEAQKAKASEHGVMWIPVKQGEVQVDEDVLRIPEGMF